MLVSIKQRARIIPDKLIYDYIKHSLCRGLPCHCQWWLYPSPSTQQDPAGTYSGSQITIPSHPFLQPTLNILLGPIAMLWVWDSATAFNGKGVKVTSSQRYKISAISYREGNFKLYFTPQLLICSYYAICSLHSVQILLVSINISILVVFTLPRYLLPNFEGRLGIWRQGKKWKIWMSKSIQVWTV